MPTLIRRKATKLFAPRRPRRQDGFTLIELVMVLAISALLTVILLSGYSNSRSRTQFTDSIERIVTLLERTKTAANSSYTTSTGVNPATIFFAKAVRFSGSTASIYTLTAANAESLSNVAINASSTETQALAWGVQYSPGTSAAVVFSRNPSNGLLKTYVVDLATLNCATGAECSAVYSSSAGMAQAALRFISPDGREATIRVNAGTGEISRTYDN